MIRLLSGRFEAAAIRKTSRETDCLLDFVLTEGCASFYEERTSRQLGISISIVKVASGLIEKCNACSPSGMPMVKGGGF